MTIRTDDVVEVGMHLFERAGLGKAPFRFVGMSENVFIVPGQAPRAGGSCDYCGTSIRMEFHIRSADGRESKVGCDCIAKVGDSGLIRAYKSSPEYRKIQFDKRRAKAIGVKSELAGLIAASGDKLASLPHPMNFTDRQTGQPLTALDWANWMIANCGDSGRASVLRRLKTMIFGQQTQTK